MQSARDVNAAATWLPSRWDMETDIVVVGYGGAGVCAAITAHDAGDGVLVLEKAPVGGGNTGCSGGGMRIPADIPNAIKYYTGLTKGTVEAESIKALAEAMHALPQQLEAWGAELEWVDRGKCYYPTLPGASAFHRVANIARTTEEKERQAKAGGTVYLVRGQGLFAFLDAQAKKRPIDVRFNTPVTRLIQDPVSKEILGVAAGADGRLHVKARKGVVLACGGFQANREMLVNYLPNLTELPTFSYGTPYNTGDGIVMAAEAGAKLWHMSGAELGMFAPRLPSEHYGMGFRLERSMRPGGQAIYVNRTGRRFMDESVLLSHRKDLFKVQAFDEDTASFPNIPMFMVFDEAYRKARPIVGGHSGWWWVQKVYQWSEDNSAEVERGWISRADTVRELAGKIGVDADGLEQTIARYNADCARGEDPQFGRARNTLAPLVAPPFYATELCEPVINTQGGPKRDGRARILDRNDRPIPRLYGAGELGSFFYPLYEGASNVPEALAFGIVAAREAGGLARWDGETGKGRLPAVA